MKGCKDALLSAYNSRGGKGRGYIKGLDGRKLFARSAHSIVNLKFQSDGALLVKRAMVILFFDLIPKAGIEARLLIQQHDELQSEVYPEDVEKYKELALKAFELAGLYYKYNVPITAECKVGKNWCETH